MSLGTIKASRMYAVAAASRSQTCVCKSTHIHKSIVEQRICPSGSLQHHAAHDRNRMHHIRTHADVSCSFNARVQKYAEMLARRSVREHLLITTDQGARGGSGPRESIPRVSVTGSTAREDMDCQEPDVEEQNKKVMTFPPEWELGSPAFADFGVKQQQVTRFPSRISKRIEASVAFRTSQKMHSAI